MPSPDGSTLVAAGEFTSVSHSRAQHVAEWGCTPAISGDINGDGDVNVTALLAVIQYWGPCPPNPSTCPADIAPPTFGDGHVNVTDLLLVISNWQP